MTCEARTLWLAVRAFLRLLSFWFSLPGAALLCCCGARSAPMPMHEPGAAAAAPPVGKWDPATAAGARASATGAQVGTGTERVGARASDAAGEPDEPPVTDDHGCVTNPFRHAVRHLVDCYGQEVAAATGKVPDPSDYSQPGSHCTGLSALPDLDGDGAQEVEVTEGCSWGTHAWLHVVYFSNRGCVRFAGSLVAAELEPAESASQGVRDVESTVADGCAGNDFTWTRYRYQSTKPAFCKGSGSAGTTFLRSFDPPEGWLWWTDWGRDAAARVA
jgi:hypothetical protein